MRHTKWISSGRHTHARAYTHTHTAPPAQVVLPLAHAATPRNPQPSSSGLAGRKSGTGPPQIPPCLSVDSGEGQDRAETQPCLGDQVFREPGCAPSGGTLLCPLLTLCEPQLPLKKAICCLHFFSIRWFSPQTNAGHSQSWGQAKARIAERLSGLSHMAGRQGPTDLSQRRCLSASALAGGWTGSRAEPLPKRWLACGPRPRPLPLLRISGVLVLLPAPMTT